MTAQDYGDFDNLGEAARQHLDVNQGVTTEQSKLIHTGTTTGTPGGVPLTLKPDNVLFQQGVSILNTNSLSFGPFNVDQPGYDIWLNPFVFLGTSNLFTIELVWLDSASGQAMDHEAYDIWCAAATGGHLISGRGPTKGDQVQINLTGGGSPGSSMHVDVVLTAHSRPLLVDRWVAYSGNGGSSGITVPNSNPSKRVLAQSSFSVGAGGNASRQFPFCTTKIDLYFNTNSNTSDAMLQILDPQAVLLREITTNAQGDVQQVVQLPNVECSYKVINNNAAAKVLSVYAIMMDY